MKKLILFVSLMLSFNAFSVSIVQTVLSPIATATRLLQVTIVAPFQTTLATIQSRGVAGREQIKDDLVALNEDIIAGRVDTIDQVRQPALKELLEEISNDDVQMEEINATVTEGSELHKVATAVSYMVLAE